MENGRIIIGSGFGDEGKGLVTDYLSKDWAELVVRFNGGAQAGHTVKKEDGRCHVFGHFGSGTFNDIATYLSSYFVVNPILFTKELNELHKKGEKPRVYVNQDCIVSTIFDMFINQTIEKWRGDDRHGSCGIGFNEAITRHLDSEYKLTVNDLVLDVAKSIEMLDLIWTNYVPSRLNALGVSMSFIEDRIKDIDYSIMRTHQHTMISYFLDHIKVVDDSILDNIDNVVFEGAQGLLLDEFHKWFPHVTRSRTGIKNVNKLLIDRSDVKAIIVTYVTRPYMTRHGAGPFPTEHNLSYNIVDKTNVPNEHQGSLRFGYFDLRLFKETISNDLLNYTKNTPIVMQIVLTCMDQIDDIVYCYDEAGALCEIPKEDFPIFLEEVMNVPILVNKSSITPDKMEIICTNEEML